MTKQELLDADERRWLEICTLFDRVPADAWEAPGASGEGWTPKDVLAHIAVWHARATDILECLRVGKDPGQSFRTRTEIDAFNEEKRKECSDLSLHDVRAMSGACRHRFREEIAQVDELTDGKERLIASNGAGHYEEHIPDLERFLSAR